MTDCGCEVQASNGRRRKRRHGGKDRRVSMRKRLISAIPIERVALDRGGGLDLANVGTVEITSEDEAYPIECALKLGESLGGRAAESGPQIIRLLFAQPQKLKRIWLVFE